MKVTVAEVRAKYPEPVRQGVAAQLAGDRCAYCVGGALGLYLREMRLLPDNALQAFPAPWVLAVWLTTANPDLTWALSHHMAHQIVDWNDRGYFDRAWDMLGMALEVQP